jgi:tRNA pseudouridine38-40 synthase
MHNYKLVLEYDGTDYRGWQKQPGLPTVQRSLEDALSHVAVLSSPLYAAGRTDAGVHARGQVVSFHGEIKPALQGLPNALNAFLPRDIVIKGCEEVAEDFNARHSALAREYIYYIDHGSFPSPFTRRFTYHYRDELDLGAMADALHMIEGEHDFTAFSRRDEGRSSVREVFEAELLHGDEVLGIRIKANAFVWMMMRMLCGSLLEVGRGKWTAERFREVLEAGDNSSSGPALPPGGLFLERVYY